MSTVNNRVRKTSLQSLRVLAMLVLALLLIGACSADGADPGETVQAYIDGYNDRDIDAVMAVFATDAVITNHPFALVTEGAAAIRELQIQDIEAAGGDNAYVVSDLEVSGDSVVWNHTWNNTCVGTGNEAIVESGKIVSWDFASVSC